MNSRTSATKGDCKEASISESIRREEAVKSHKYQPTQNDIAQTIFQLQISKCTNVWYNSSNDSET